MTSRAPYDAVIDRMDKVMDQIEAILEKPRGLNRGEGAPLFDSSLCDEEQPQSNELSLKFGDIWGYIILVQPPANSGVGLNSRVAGTLSVN